MCARSPRRAPRFFLLFFFLSPFLYFAFFLLARVSHYVRPSSRSRSGTEPQSPREARTCSRARSPLVHDASLTFKGQETAPRRQPGENRRATVRSDRRRRDRGGPEEGTSIRLTFVRRGGTLPPSRPFRRSCRPIATRSPSARLGWTTQVKEIYRSLLTGGPMRPPRPVVLDQGCDFSRAQRQRTGSDDE